MFVRSCPCYMLHSRTYVLVVRSSLPKLCCQSDSPFLFLHIASQSSFYRRAIIHYAVTQTLYFVVPILELLPSMGVTSSFSTLRVFLWRLAVSRFHSFSDVDTVFYLSIYPLPPVSIGFRMLIRYSIYLSIYQPTTQPTENEPCKVCPLSAYRSPSPDYYYYYYRSPR